MSENGRSLKYTNMAHFKKNNFHTYTHYLGTYSRNIYHTIQFLWTDLVFIFFEMPKTHGKVEETKGSFIMVNHGRRGHSKQAAVLKGKVSRDCVTNWDIDVPVVFRSKQSAVYRFYPVNSSVVEHEWHIKQGDCRCTMAGTGFNSVV
jgi:hypothetical protein